MSRVAGNHGNGGASRADEPHHRSHGAVRSSSRLRGQPSDPLPNHTPEAGRQQVVHSTLRTRVRVSVSTRNAAGLLPGERQPAPDRSGNLGFAARFDSRTPNRFPSTEQHRSKRHGAFANGPATVGATSSCSARAERAALTSEGANGSSASPSARGSGQRSSVSAWQLAAVWRSSRGRRELHLPGPTGECPPWWTTHQTRQAVP
jgi:hypothetical protein